MTRFHHACGKRPRAQWLTIGDVLRMKPKQSLRVLKLDGSHLEHLEHNKPNLKYTPQHFFRDDIADLVRRHGLNCVLHGVMQGEKWRVECGSAKTTGTR